LCNIARRYFPKLNEADFKAGGLSNALLTKLDPIENEQSFPLQVESYEYRSCAYFSVNLDVPSTDNSSTRRKIGIYCTHLDVYYESIRMQQLDMLLVRLAVN
jgi:endonuclease/exonuclease/phosphatase family metal-dependent hydrolase